MDIRNFKPREPQKGVKVNQYYVGECPVPLRTELIGKNEEIIGVFTIKKLHDENLMPVTTYIERKITSKWPFKMDI